MSLFDYLNNDASSTSSLSSQMQLLVQQAQAKLGTSVSSSTAATGTAASQPAVLITMDAQRASAEAEDAKKDPAKLAAEVRAKLDKGGKDAAMGSFSGRALAMVALNDDGTFSRAEIGAAKSELRERDRQSALAFLNSGELTASSLKAYGQGLLAARQTMSGEERQLRTNDPNLR